MTSEAPETTAAVVSTPTLAPVVGKPAGKHHLVYLAIIAVLATLLLIVVGLMAFGRLVFLPAGMQRFGGPGGGAGRELVIDGKKVDPSTLSEEERKELFEERGSGQARPADEGATTTQ